LNKEEECEIEIGEGCPTKEELNGIVYELELEDNLAEEALARCPDPEHVDGGVEGSEERAVEPSASLRDEFGNGRGHICGGLGRFDVFKDPAFFLLHNNLKAEDSILGKVHVSFEKSSTVGTITMHGFTLEVGGQRAFAIWSVLECPVSVGAEGTWQDRNVPEHTLQWLIEDV
jgi:hypothetical protein